MWGKRQVPYDVGWFVEMCSGSEAGSHVRLIDCVYHSTLGVRAIKKKKDVASSRADLAVPTSRPRPPQEQRVAFEAGIGSLSGWL